ncbi:MAG: hypothetical protein IIY21_13475 [Clostridiales bacterium]|nr:hypothetical protein [Clostridiales bacterium]
MAQSKSQKNSKARQRYYQREYERLISQGKKLYNSMNLGAVFGVETPSFEDILNYAGTKSGLKRPTKASLKALRRVSSEKGILWGVEKTLGKKASKEAKANITMMRREEDIHRSALGEARHKLSKEIKRVSQQGNLLSKQEQKDYVNDIMNPISSMLSQLRYFRNYTFSELKIMYKIKKLSLRGTDRIYRLETANKCCNDCLDKIQDTLITGETDQIAFLSKKCEEFFDENGDVTIQELYEDGPRLRPKIFAQLLQAIEEGTGNKTDEPSPSEDPTANWTMNDFEDFPDLF